MKVLLLPTGTLPAPVFGLQWVGGGCVMTHERGKRVCGRAGHGER